MSVEPVSSGSAAAGPVAGRTREQALLASALSALGAGQGGLVLISGEAGIGKSTLVEAAAQVAYNLPATILRGHCYDLSITPPYGPWIEIVAAYQPRPGWPTLPAFIDDRDALEALVGQDDIFRQIAQFYADLAQQQPLLLVLEDLHWADAPSLDLLRFLSRSLAAQPILFLVTYRDDEPAFDQPLAQIVPLLVREAAPLRLKLPRFDSETIGELLRRRYPLTDHDHQRLRVMLAERAEGNPFFIDELLRVLEDEGILRPGTPVWTLGSLTRVPLPALIRQIVDRRVRALPPDSRRLLALGAIIGTTIPLDLWRQVSELPEATFAEQLRPSIERGLLVDARLPDRLGFSHALIQAALADGVILPQRRLWHRAVAEALLALPHPDPSLVAEHFQLAGDQRAVEWLSRAGRQAQRLYAWHIAIERYEAALSLLSSDESHARERGWLCYRLGRVLCYRDGARSRYYLDEAARLGETTGDGRLAACAIAELGYRCTLDGEYQRGIRLLADGLTRFDRLPAVDGETTPGQLTLPTLKHGMDELRGQRIIWVGMVESLSGAVRDAEEMLARANASELGQANSAVQFATTYSALGVSAGCLGEIERAHTAFGRARALYRNPFAVGLTIDAEFAAVNRRFHADQPDLLDQEAEASRRCMENAVSEGIVPEGTYSLASVDLGLLRGADWDTTEAILQRGVTTHPAAYFRQLARAFLGQLAASRGDTEMGWRMVHEILPAGTATKHGILPFYPAVEAIDCALALTVEAGDWSRTGDWLYCLSTILGSEFELWGGCLRERSWAAYHRLRGEMEQAKTRAEYALELARANHQPLEFLAAERLLGEITLDTGDLPAADSHLTAALQLADTCRAAYERAQTLLPLARLRLEMHDQAGAATVLDELRAIARPLGAAPLLAKADTLLTPTTPERPVNHPDTLTPREVDVLRLVALGLSDAEVADRLYVSPRTVSSHLSSIYGKLGVRSRTEAVHIAGNRQLY